MRPTGRPTLKAEWGGSSNSCTYSTDAGAARSVALSPLLSQSLSLSMSCCSHAPVASAKGRQRQWRSWMGVQPADNFPCKSKIGFARASVMGPASADKCRQLPTVFGCTICSIKISERTKFVGGNRSQSAPGNPLPSLLSFFRACLCCCLCLFLYPLNAFCAHFEIVAHLHFWFDLVVVFFSPPASSPIQLCFDFVLPWADSFFLFVGFWKKHGNLIEKSTRFGKSSLETFARVCKVNLYICKYMYVYDMCVYILYVYLFFSFADISLKFWRTDV